MSTRCNIEFYSDFETSNIGKWGCTCEDQTWRRGPAGEYCDHILDQTRRQFSMSKSFTAVVASRTRRSKTHTVTYTALAQQHVSKLSARIYQHADGYPEGIIPQLRRLEDVVSGKNQTKSVYGSRVDDPEWCAAEFISLFRQSGGGNVYVSQEIHGDIAYLYKVYCHQDGFRIAVFEPHQDHAGTDYFTDVTSEFHPLTGNKVGG
jgi:hypothetical protein